MNINFGEFTIQEAQVILAALKKLPMEVVETLHNKLLAMANEQFLAQLSQPDDITKVDEITPEQEVA